MVILSSRSATILVILVISLVAFCLASVFGAMTGTVSILPSGTDDTSINNVTVTNSDNVDHSYNNNYDDYSYSGDDSSDSSDVETTTDNPNSNNENSQSGDSNNVETTTAQSSTQTQSEVETTTDATDANTA